MIKTKYLVFSLLAVLFSARAQALTSGDWKLHPSFDKTIEKVIDTPDKVYMQALQQEYSASYAIYSKKYPTLFVYDKESEEMTSYNKRNRLSDNIVSYLDYNADKRYLLVNYDSGDIDMIFDSGEVINVPALKNSTLPYSKIINSTSFDYTNNRAYLAMPFGYIVVNDKKGEIAESHIFNKNITAAGRVGDYVLISDGQETSAAPASKKSPTLNDFVPVSGLANVSRILPLGGNTFAFLSGSVWYKAMLNADGTLASSEKKNDNSFTNVVGNKNGYVLISGGQCVQIDKDGNFTAVLYDTPDRGIVSGTWDGKEFWFAKGRHGLYSRSYNNGTWTTTREAILPNAPTAFQCQYFVPTRNYGMLVTNHGINKTFPHNAYQYPNMLCGYKGGEWTTYSPAWLNPSIGNPNPDPNGLAIDPDDDKYAYSGSFYRGLVRLNLEDPKDIAQMSSPGSKFANSTFYEAFPSNTSWGAYALVTSPCFDASGNLWMYYGFAYGGETGRLHCLKADDRRAGRLDKWINFDLKEPNVGPDNCMLALKHAANKNLVVIFTGQNDSELIIFDHNGTLDNTADDRVAIMGDIFDQDGAKVSKNCIHNFYEDMDGTVWALTDYGIFTFNPQKAFTNPQSVNRIKVSRNDGTNLADYLLDGVNTWQMTADNQGRKWFATAGAGLVMTSADGREVLAQYTTTNSFIPDNTLYSVAYNSDNNSIMMSSQKGIAEFFPAGAASAEKMDNVKIYPNPVRPDYFGYVTIEGLVDNALVKIVDASGNLVSELDPAASGVAQWDVCNTEHRRVRSGVYYVIASSGPNSSDAAHVGKILVVN